MRAIASRVRAAGFLEAVRAGRDVGFAAPIERRERALAGGGDRQVEVAGVVAGAARPDQLLVLEAAQQAAEIAGVEAEVASQIGGGGPLAMRKLPEQRDS